MGKQRSITDTPEQRRGSTPGWDSSDEGSWESFPASDPPAVGSVFGLEPPPEVAAAVSTGAERGEEDEQRDDDGPDSET